jgi:hypothetical protein
MNCWLLHGTEDLKKLVSLSEQAEGWHCPQNAVRLCYSCTCYDKGLQQPEKAVLKKKFNVNLAHHEEG